MTDSIKIQEHNVSWDGDFKKESAKVKAILGSNCVAVVHIGSTAMKNVKSRPMIDIMVLVKDIFDVDPFNEELEKYGYEAGEQYGPLGRYVYVKQGDPVSYQLQVYENGDYDDIQKFLAFRDYVDSDKTLADAYTALKEEHAKKQDSEAYKEAKGDFIKKVLEDAITWHELKHKKDMSVTMGIILGIILAVLVSFVAKNVFIGVAAGLIFAVCIYFVFLGAMKKKKTGAIEEKK